MVCRDRCANLGLELILVFFGILMTVGFIVTYIIAVQEEHVVAFLPYISNTGQDRPESCVFTLICGLGAIFLLVMVCLRYKHLHHYNHHTLPEMHCLNGLSTVVGVLSALGLLIVGSFQDNAVSTVHFIGAIMAFGFGVTYEWIQTGITIRLWRSRLTPYVGCCLIIFRLVFSLFSSLMFLGAIIGGVFGSHDQGMKNADTSTLMGIFHIVSASAEWLLAFSFMLFFLTFHPDFTRISLDFGVKLKYHHHTDVIHRHSIISTDDENTPLTI